MPISEPLASVLSDKRFWLAYLRNQWYEDAPAELDGLRVELVPAAGFGLILVLQDPVESLFLQFRHPGVADPVDIGSEHSGRSCGNVLRWDEVDRLARAVSLLDPEWTHPGLATLLLLPFAPIRPGDDVDRIFPLFEAALHSLGLLTEQEVADQIVRLDRRREAARWRLRDPLGWVLDLPAKLAEGIDHEEDSSRAEGCAGDPNPGDFPHEAWDKMLAAARRTCRDAIRPEWLLGEAGTWAREAATSGRLDDLPRLADALAQAGCAHAGLLGGCRNPAQAARACVTLELLARFEPGDLIRRHFGPTTNAPRRYFLISIYVPIYADHYARDRRFGARLREALRRTLLAGEDVVLRHNILFPAYGARRDVEKIEQYLLMYATTWKDPIALLDEVRALLNATGPIAGTRLRFGDPMAGDLALIPLVPPAGG